MIRSRVLRFLLVRRLLVVRFRRRLVLRLVLVTRLLVGSRLPVVVRRSRLLMPMVRPQVSLCMPNGLLTVRRQRFKLTARRQRFNRQVTCRAT